MEMVQGMESVTAWGQSLQGWSITQMVAGVLIILLVATVFQKILKPIRYLLFIIGLFAFAKGLVDITLLYAIGQNLWSLLQSVVTTIF